MVIQIWYGATLCRADGLLHAESCGRMYAPVVLLSHGCVRREVVDALIDSSHDKGNSGRCLYSGQPYLVLCTYYDHLPKI